jgi:hypothetical protein
MFRKSSFALCILALLTLGASVAGADSGSFSSKCTITYPADDPVFSVTFPENWSTETDENIIHATPNDSSLYLGIWALEKGSDLDAALDAVDEAVSSLVKDLKVGEVDSTVINDIQFLNVDGTGKDEDGNPVNVSVALFSPDKEQIFILLYFGTPDAENTHEDDLVGILKSINGEE